MNSKAKKVIKAQMKRYQQKAMVTRDLLDYFNTADEVFEERPVTNIDQENMIFDCLDMVKGKITAIDKEFVPWASRRDRVYEVMDKNGLYVVKRMFSDLEELATIIGRQEAKAEEAANVENKKDSGSASM